MAHPGKPVIILMADDDPDDVLLTEDALREADIASTFRTVGDGAELLNYLLREEGYTERNAPRPDIILLDLNMPRVTGHEVLMKLQEHEDLAHIPVLVITTSGDSADIEAAYRTGARSYIQKPRTFGELVDTMTTLGTYWFRVVDLPENPDSSPAPFRMTPLGL